MEKLEPLFEQREEKKAKREKPLLKENPVFESDDAEDEYKALNPGPVMVYPKIADNRVVFSEAEWQNLRDVEDDYLE